MQRKMPSSLARARSRPGPGRGGARRHSEGSSVPVAVLALLQASGTPWFKALEHQVLLAGSHPCPPTAGTTGS